MQDGDEESCVGRLVSNGWGEEEEKKGWGGMQTR